MPDKKTLRIGIIGIGGFAGAHQDVVCQLEQTGECKEICTCDPGVENFDDIISQFHMVDRGVKLYDNYMTMLDECGSSLDLVMIPTPIPLHAEMHKECVRRGLPVYLEKPPTLFYEEMEQMLAVEAQAAKLTHVGFNFIVEPERQALKRRILDGEFGQLREVRVLATWPRGRPYFDNSYWKGRLVLEDGRPVLESCLGNAMGHYVHDALFWAGSNELFSWAEAQEAESEFYRANDIESTDALFVRARTQEGPVLRFATVVAYDGPAITRETVVLDKATISYTPVTEYRVDWNDGRVENGKVGGAGIRENLLVYLAYLRGEAERPINRLIDCAPFVRLYDMAFMASGGIHAIPEQYLERTKDEHNNELVAVSGIEDVAAAFTTQGKFPSQQGIAWARPGSRAVASDLPKLRNFIQETLL